MMGVEAKAAIPAIIDFANAGVSDPADHNTINGRHPDISLTGKLHGI